MMLFKENNAFLNKTDLKFNFALRKRLKIHETFKRDIHEK